MYAVLQDVVRVLNGLICVCIVLCMRLKDVWSICSTKFARFVYELCTVVERLCTSFEWLCMRVYG